MKKLITTIFIAAIFFTTLKTSAQNANTSLSNLATTTKINSDLLPDASAHNLGSANNSWTSIYLKGGLYIDKKKFISTAGNLNTFIGSQAGKSFTGGGYNVALGNQSLYSSTSSYYNTALGYSSLYSNTSGSFNTATGTECLYYNQSGEYNTASGYYAMGENVSGDYNVATGFEALQHNADGSYNTATGFYSLLNNGSGICNTGEGGYSMYNNTGSYNTAVGYYALEATTGAQYNTAVGFEAGDTYDNGYNNVFVGANTDVNGAGYYNVIAIGQGTICTGSSQVTIGNGATGSYRAYANWTDISDARVKRNIKQNVPGLAFINKLQPVTYNLDLAAIDNIIQAQRKDSTGKIIPLSNIEMTARNEKEKVTYTGFIAQDVEKTAKSLNYDFSGVDAAKNSKDLYGLRYAEFVVPLVKAVQELSKMNDDKDAQINNLETRLSRLEAMMETSSKNIQQTTNVSSATLSQNAPNPFTSSTNISYSLPQNYSSAKIIITDSRGAPLKEITLTAKGNGSVNVDAAMLSAGAYQYTLYVDGKIIDTKKMIAAK